MKKLPATYAVCIRKNDCDDLILRKLYQAIKDKAAAKEKYVRVIDESGEDYLYPVSYFITLRLPRVAATAVAGVC